MDRVRQKRQTQGGKGAGWFAFPVFPPAAAYFAAGGMPMLNAIFRAPSWPLAFRLEKKLLFVPVMWHIYGSVPSL